MDSFGKRLKALRESKGLSQSTLAEQLGIKSGKQTLSKWELDKSEPSLSEIKKLAEILGATTTWLIDGVESQPQQVHSPPPGFVMMPAEEVIEMQRQLLKKQAEKLEEQKR